MILRTFTYHFFQKQPFDIRSMHNWRLVLGKSSKIHVFFFLGRVSAFGTTLGYPAAALKLHYKHPQLISIRTLAGVGKFHS